MSDVVGDLNDRSLALLSCATYPIFGNFRPHSGHTGRPDFFTMLNWRTPIRCWYVILYGPRRTCFGRPHWVGIQYVRKSIHTHTHTLNARRVIPCVYRVWYTRTYRRSTTTRLWIEFDFWTKSRFFCSFCFSPIIFYCKGSQTFHRSALSENILILTTHNSY